MRPRRPSALFGVFRSRRATRTPSRVGAISGGSTVVGGGGEARPGCPGSSISDIPLKWLPPGQIHCLEINPIPSQMLPWGEVTQPPPSPFLLLTNRIQIPLVSVSSSSNRVPQVTSLLWPRPAEAPPRARLWPGVHLTALPPGRGGSIPGLATCSSLARSWHVWLRARPLKSRSRLDHPGHVA